MKNLTPLKWLGLSLLMIVMACGSYENKATLAVATKFDPQATALIGGDLRFGKSPVVGLDIRLKSFFALDEAYRCSGTRIAPDIILTAARCVDAAEMTTGLSFKSLKITATSLPWISANITGMRTTKVLGILIHPQYVARQEFNQDQEIIHLLGDRCKNANKPFFACLHEQEEALISRFYKFDDALKQHDIALLITEPVTDEAIASLPTAKTVLSKKENAAMAVGYGIWGYLLLDEFTGWRLQKEMTIQATNDTLLVAANPQATVCSGDSGGPLLMANADDHTMHVIGVASYNFQRNLGLWRRCLKGSGAVYTRVDAYLPWIKRSLQLACRSGMRQDEYCQNFNAEAW